MIQLRPVRSLWNGALASLSFGGLEWRGRMGRLTILWLASLILTPLAEMLLGDIALRVAIGFAVMLQATIAYLALAEAGGWRSALRISTTVVVVAWACEAFGSTTGFPFGAYRYTDFLQPQLMGVPLLIAFAWLMMLPPAWALAQRITGQRSGLLFVAASAISFTAWDLFLDPHMVRWGVWIWDRPGAYYGIPLSNFAGWLVVSALITIVVRPPGFVSPAPLRIYVLTWLTELVGLLLFWPLVGPAIGGFLGVGLVGAIGLQRSNSRMGRARSETP